MMKKVSLLLLMLLLLVVSPLIGCSSGGATNPIGLVPKNANVVGHVDLSKILQDKDLTGIYDKVPKDPSYPQTFDDALAEAKDKLGIDPSDFDEIVLFSDTSESTGEDSSANFALIVKGTFNKSDLLNAIETAAEEAAVQLDITDYKGYEIYTVADEEGTFVFLSNTMLAFGPTEWVKNVVDVEKGDAPALSGELLDTYNKLGDALLKLAMAVPPNAGEGKLGESASQYLGDLSAFDKVESVGMTLTKNEKAVALDVKLCCADSDSAQSIEQSINGLITLVKLLMAMSENQQQNQALDTFLEKVEISRADSCVNINITTTLTEIEDLIQSSGQTA